MRSPDALLQQALGEVSAGDPATAALAERLRVHGVDFLEPAERLYGDRADFATWAAAVLDTVIAAHQRRSEALRRWDAATAPDWFQVPEALGYAAYADRFAGSLRGVAEHLDYLSDLGITYLHLMPFLRWRAGENDGGYAVADPREVEPSLGDRADLEALTAALHGRGIRLCMDLVLNHVAREHPWAAAARRGEAAYRDYFLTYADRREPDAYEASLPQIFPASAPGNFTFEAELGRWVWTTFHRYQWDLNWASPTVFKAMLEVMLDFANLGVDVFRLDAVAFMWKRHGTACQNQPEVHQIVRALRALMNIAAPCVVLKAEAIVGSEHLPAYLGASPEVGGKAPGGVSQLAYHNNLMAHLWSALATRNARPLARLLARLPAKPSDTAWITYVRCHDDIGWAVDDDDVAAEHWDGAAHRRFLADYYSGAFAGSHAVGEVFQANPESGDRRSCGTTASLCGLEQALGRGDTAGVTLSIERILLLHAILLAFDGLPVLYMGDELGLLNDWRYGDEPAHRGDPRWLHRPAMDWQAAGRRHIAGSIEARIYNGLQQLIRARRRCPELHAAVGLQVRPPRASRPAVFSFVRPHAGGRLVALFNVSEVEQRVPAPPERYDRITQHTVDVTRRTLRLPPYGRLWLVRDGPRQHRADS